MRETDFRQWITSRVVLLGAAGTLVSLTSSIDKIWGALGNTPLLQHPFIIIYSVQLLLTLAAFAYVEPWRREYERIEQSKLTDVLYPMMLNFRMWWRVLLFAWAVQYMIYLTQQVLIDFGAPPVQQVQQDQGAPRGIHGWIPATQPSPSGTGTPLATASEVPGSQPSIQDNRASRRIPGWIPALAMKGEIVAFFGLYVSMSRNRRNSLGDFWTWLLVALIVVMLSFVEFLIEEFFPGGYGGTVSVAISYSILAVVIALAIGRLDTSRIRVGAVIIVSLYLYAAMQPMFPLAKEGFVIVLFSFTLFLKALLIAFVTWIISAGLLSRYVGSAARTAPFNPGDLKPVTIDGKLKGLKSNAKPVEMSFVVDMRYSDSLVPRDVLETAGIVAIGKRFYEDVGLDVPAEMEYGYAIIEFDGVFAAGNVAFAPKNSVARLGTGMVEGLGLAFDETLKAAKILDVVPLT